MSAPASQSQYTYLIEQGIAAGKKPDISDACIYDAVFSHDTRWNGAYPWLEKSRGKILWLDFYEAKYGRWISYNTYWFSRHAALVSHEPEKLVEEHVHWYVGENGKPPKIQLRFWFQKPNGIVYSMAPTREFYELERDWFLEHHFCHKHPEEYEPKFDPDKSEGPEYLYTKTQTH